MPIDLGKTKPAVAASGGVFIREDFGKDNRGRSAPALDGKPGLFGVPTALSEPEARAVELHEYAHLAVNRTYPEVLQMMRHIRANGEVEEIAYQTMMDVFVNCQCETADPDTKEIISHLRAGDNTEETIRDLSRRFKDTSRDARSKLAVAQMLGTMLQLYSTSSMQLEAERILGPERETLKFTPYDEVVTAAVTIKNFANCVVNNLASDARNRAEIKTGMESIVPDEKERRKFDKFITRMDQNERALLNYLLRGFQAFKVLTTYLEQKEDRAYNAELVPGEMLVPKAYAHAIISGAHTEKLSRKTRWGAMKVVHPKLPVLHDEGFLHKSKPRYSFAGPFRYPSRALLPASDGSCFGVKRRIKGGTVLIDISGSMGLRTADIEELMTMLPACVIAAYSSDDTGMKGYLTVLAEKGYRVKEVTRVLQEIGHSTGNVVDGPALIWLSQQQLKPHVWISDGIVTGVNDLTNTVLTTECQQFVRRNDIYHLAQLGPARDWIKRNPQFFVH